MSKTPGRKDKFFTSLLFESNLPLWSPLQINIELINPIVAARINGEMPIIAAPIPAPNASSERAIPRTSASTPLIVPDLSKSASDGFCKI